MGEGFWGHLPGFGPFGLLFWLLVIAGIVWLVKSLGSSGAGRRDGEDDPALRVLRERFARGEIDEEEFQRRKRELES